MVKKLMEDTREIRYIYTINKASYNVGGDVGHIILVGVNAPGGIVGDDAGCSLPI